LRSYCEGVRNLKHLVPGATEYWDQKFRSRHSYSLNNFARPERKPECTNSTTFKQPTRIPGIFFDNIAEDIVPEIINQAPYLSSNTDPLADKIHATLQVGFEPNSTARSEARQARLALVTLRNQIV
jgi:hypothetical protein